MPAASAALATPRHPDRGLVLRVSAALIMIVLAATILAQYPLSRMILAAALLAYAALLWVCPVAFPLLLPAVFPAWDLGAWTGWMMLGESDLFLLVTLAVLLLRTSPGRNDLWPTGVPGAVLAGFVALWTVAMVVGLASPLGAPPSDNPFLRPDNAIRLTKGLAESLLLLPFLRFRQRTRADAGTWLGYGMATGIVAVTLAVLAERALFPGILDFTADYRVAGPFSSMRVGGGHIGGYVVLALPFVICLPRRPAWLGLALPLLVCLCGGYTLAVTFARTAYAAGLVALTLAGGCWLFGVHRRNRSRFSAPIPILVIAAAVLAAAFTGGMRSRFAESGKDSLTRLNNWQAGLAIRDRGPLSELFGMGLGTYQRAMLTRSLVNRPSDLVLRRDGQGAYVAVHFLSPFFLGQKIALPPSGSLHLHVMARSPDNGTRLSILLCDKLLLYSDQCRGDDIGLASPGAWQPITLALPIDGLGRAVGPLRRPVELSFSGTPLDRWIDIRDVRLTDDSGASMLANGDFAAGLDRWIFTDDSHVSWRMLNQYLMLWFETGWLGLGAYLAVAALALAGGIRAARRGIACGAAIAGSVAGFLLASVSDNLLEAPRLAMLFFLVCLSGLILGERPAGSPAA